MQSDVWCMVYDVWYTMYTTHYTMLLHTSKLLYVLCISAYISNSIQMLCCFEYSVFKMGFLNRIIFLTNCDLVYYAIHDVSQVRLALEMQTSAQN